MPELPDVEVFKRYIDATSLGQEIESLYIPQSKVLNVSPSTLRRHLKGKEFVSTERRGKFLFLKTGDKAVLMLHFGMTGFPKYYEKEEEEPDHVRLRCDFKGGGHFAFDCQRMFGEVEVTDSIEEFIKNRELGPDALSLSEGDFRDLLEGGRGAIKSTLMNQSLICGLGNVYSDEILFQAKIHPKTRAEKLEEKDVKRLYRNMIKICEKTIENKAEPGKAPRTWLLPHRSKGEDCPRCDSAIEKITVSGRAGYYCSGCQGKEPRS